MKPGFTRREFEVLKAMTEGYHSTQELTELFNLAPQTINSYISNMFTRTGIHKRSKLIKAAIDNRWLEPGNGANSHE